MHVVGSRSHFLSSNSPQAKWNVVIQYLGSLFHWSYEITHAVLYGSNKCRPSLRTRTKELTMGVTWSSKPPLGLEEAVRWNLFMPKTLNYYWQLIMAKIFPSGRTNFVSLQVVRVRYTPSKFCEWNPLALSLCFTLYFAVCLHSSDCFV